MFVDIKNNPSKNNTINTKIDNARGIQPKVPFTLINMPTKPKLAVIKPIPKNKSFTLTISTLPCYMCIPK